MPLYRPVDSLASRCSYSVAKSIHNFATGLKKLVTIFVESKRKYSNKLNLKKIAYISVDFENDKTNMKRTRAYLERKTALTSILSNLPAVYVEETLSQILDSIIPNLVRSLQKVGLIMSLDILLRSHLRNLNLESLFYKMRLQPWLSSLVKETLLENISKMKSLTRINLVSKADDDILISISKHCDSLISLNVTLSDVTDIGVTSIARNCPNLESLVISECWNVTEKGVKEILLYSENLKEIIYHDLVYILLRYFRNSKKTFKLTHLEQKQMSEDFEPQLDDALWIERKFPDLYSVKLSLEDQYLELLPRMGKLTFIELELLSDAGHGFTKAILSLQNTLTSLYLSCDSIHRCHIELIGTACDSLTSFRLVTEKIFNEENLSSKNCQSFRNLRNFHLQVVKESTIHRELIEYFLTWCHNLKTIVIKAQMGFFNDKFLRQLFSINALHDLVSIILNSDTFLPLTSRSVDLLLENCPNLERLEAISSWDISEENFFEIKKMVKDNNYLVSVN